MASLAAELQTKRQELEALNAKLAQTVGVPRPRPAQGDGAPRRASASRDAGAKRTAEEHDAASGRMRSVVAPSRDERQAKRTKVQAEPSERRPRPSVVTSSSDKARNKRMFGVLMGSLQRANKEAATKTTAEKKMLEIDDRLAEQRKADREAFHQEKAELLQERHAKKAELFELEQKADLASWTTTWRRHRDALKNFILCQPKDDADALPIFYLPAKHTEESQKRLEATAGAIDAQLAKAEADHWKVMAFPEPPPRGPRTEEGAAAMDADGDEAETAAGKAPAAAATEAADATAPAAHGPPGDAAASGAAMDDQKDE